MRPTRSGRTGRIAAAVFGGLIVMLASLPMILPDNSDLGPPPPQEEKNQPPPAPLPKSQTEEAKSPLAISTYRGDAPYQVGEHVVLRLHANHDIYVYCYYEDANGKSWRIFPNRFQPQAMIPAEQTIELPPPGGESYLILLDHPGAELFVCFLFEKQPDERALGPDLTPNSVSINDLIARFRKLNLLDISNLLINVRP